MVALYCEVDCEGPPPSEGVGYGDFAASMAISRARQVRAVERRGKREGIKRSEFGRRWLLSYAHHVYEVDSSGISLVRGVVGDRGPRG
jgi:hypothetical protein